MIPIKCLLHWAVGTDNYNRRHAATYIIHYVNRFGTTTQIAILIMK